MIRYKLFLKIIYLLIKNFNLISNNKNIDIIKIKYK